MVKEIRKNGKTLYICEACGFAYAEKEWAQKCQDFCAEYKGCSLEITSHAVSLSETGLPLSRD